MSKEMQNQVTLKRRYFVFGVIAILIAAGSMILCLNTEANFRGQIFLQAFRHGAVDRKWYRTYIGPSFDDPNNIILWKIQEPSHIPDLTDVPPMPSITKSDADLLMHMATAAPPLKQSYSRIFQFGYFLGWDWVFGLIPLVVLVSIGILICIRILIGQVKALQRRNSVKA